MSEIYTDDRGRQWTKAEMERMFSGLTFGLTLNQYQQSLHTYKDRHHECHALGLVGELAEVLEEIKGMANNPCFLSTDREVFIKAGRIADMVKKATAHGVPLDREKLKKELGDVLWYITAVASDNKLTLQEIAEANVAKLRARYPEGFVKGGGVREEKATHAPTDISLAGGVPQPLGGSFFNCGCSRTVDSHGFEHIKRCADGECRRTPR
jgi:NTP pyrophosphatase (non-canonical NTP hydrolase)